jgi:hypothetical protein
MDPYEENNNSNRILAEVRASSRSQNGNNFEVLANKPKEIM